MALTSLSLKQLRRKAAAAIGGFEWGTVSSLTADTLVTTLGKLSGRTPQTYSGWYIFRPDNMSSSGNPSSVTGDRVKVVTQFVPSTRTFTHSFGNSDYTGITATGSTVAIDDATNATPIVITTSSAHGYSTGDTVTIAGVSGNTNANGVWTITVLTSTTFSLDGSSGNAAYSAGTDTAQRNEQFELHRYLDPDDPFNGWLAAINRGLGRIYHRSKLPFSQIRDGDLQEADATAYTASNATVAKTASGYFGARGLQIAPSSDAGYAQTTSLRVMEGTGVSCAVLVLPTVAGNAPQVQAYDNTNSAVIDTFTVNDVSGNDDDQLRWCCIYGAFTVPNNCRQVSLRLGFSVRSGTVGYTVGGIWLQEQATNRWLLPSSITERGQVLGFYQIGNLNWNPETWTELEIEPDRIDVDPTANKYGPSYATTAGSVHFAHKATRLLLIETWQPYPAFSTLVGHAGHDDQMVSVDERIAVAAIKAEALHLIKNTGRYLAMPYQGDIDRAIAAAEEEFASLAHLTQRPAPKVRPHVWVGTR